MRGHFLSVCKSVVLPALGRSRKTSRFIPANHCKGDVIISQSCRWQTRSWIDLLLAPASFIFLIDSSHTNNRVVR